MTCNHATVLARLQGLIGDMWNCHGYTKATNPEFQRALGSAIILLAPLAPHFCSELWAILQAVPNKTCQDFLWDKSVFHQVYSLQIKIVSRFKSTFPIGD